MTRKNANLRMLYRRRFTKPDGKKKQREEKGDDYNMGIFTNFLINGFQNDEDLALYSPGTLYEVTAKLDETITDDAKRNKVKSLLTAWDENYEVLKEQGKKVPVYALEIHAVTEKARKELYGYGTYVFVPDEAPTTFNTLRSLYSEPLEFDDEEDPLKALAATYCDENGYSLSTPLTIQELTVDKPDYFPLKQWDNKTGLDPLVEFFGIFDSMKPNQFAGISIVLIPPKGNYDLPARKHIRSMEDPAYTEEIGFFEELRRVIKGEPLPDEEADRLVGYKKTELDPAEKAQIDAIKQKILNPSESVFNCTIRVYASTPKLCDDLCDTIIKRTDNNSVNGNRLVRTNERIKLQDLALRHKGNNSFLISATELAAIWHVVSAKDTTGDLLHAPMPSATHPPDDLNTIKRGGEGDIRNLFLRLASN